MPARKNPAEGGAKVAADNAIHDGKGGYLKKGDVLPEGADVASLKAKGFAE